MRSAQASSKTSGKRPVAITGIGMICPSGLSVSECWGNMLEGRSAVREITKFNPVERIVRIGGQLPEGYDAFEKRNTSKRLFKQTMRATRLMRLCAVEALQSAALNMAELDGRRCGVIIGTSGSSDRRFDDIEDPAHARFKVIREMVNASSAWISIESGFQGPSYNVIAASASSAFALVQACELIRSGGADVVLTGGMDLFVNENNILRGKQMNLLSDYKGQPEKAMRPFERDRRGWVFSDGGCALVLESYEHAKRRQAKVYAWIAGCSSMSGFYHNPGIPAVEETMAGVMAAALSDGSVLPEDMGYISANGTSSVLQDRCETAAVRTVFGKHAYKLCISSVKSVMGHTFGASGAIGCAVAALALYTNSIPPTINYERPDPACDLNYVPNTMLTLNDLNYAMVNSFDVDSHNCALVLAKHPFS